MNETVNKNRLKHIRVLAFLGACLLLWMTVTPSALAGGVNQQPTGSIPTVTGTVSGVILTVNSDQETMNVRSGPGTTSYPTVGILVAGQQVVALGRTPGGDWIQIVYPGVPGGVAWVYAGFVTLGPGELPIVEPPPTPTPQTTPTIDPTLAAQFDIQSTPTRLPTFTAAAPVAIPTFEEPSDPVGFGVPPGLVIVSLGVVGIFSFLISLLRRR